MNYYLWMFLNSLVIIPAAIAIIRLKYINPVFLPFVYCLWAAAFNALFGIAAAHIWKNNIVNGNIYVLAEALLYLWFFKNVGILKNKKWLWLLISIVFISWFADLFYHKRIDRLFQYYRIIYCFILVLVSITQINRLIISDINQIGERSHVNILGNSVFLICIAVIIFFTFNILVEIFYLYGLNGSSDFRTSVFKILTYVDVFTNLIFTLAVLWIPPKREYILLS